MVQLAAMRITSVGVPSACSPVARHVHSSACILRGIVVGGAGGRGSADRSSDSSLQTSAQPLPTGGRPERSLFSALQREVRNHGLADQSGIPPSSETTHLPQPNIQHRRAERARPSDRATRVSNTPGNADARANEPLRSPSTSSEARAEVLEQDSQSRRQQRQQGQRGRRESPTVQQILRTPLPDSGVAQSTTSAQPAPVEQASSEWSSLRHRIQQTQAVELEAAASRRSSKTQSPQNELHSRVRRPLLNMQVGKTSATIESIPSWHVASEGLSRSIAFKDTVASRMFLQATTSLLLSEPGWKGEVSLQRTGNGAESVRVRLAGSMPEHEDRPANPVTPRHDAVTEHDVELAEALDRYLAKTPRGRESFTRQGRKAEVRQAPSSTSIDDVVPVAVQAKQVPGEQAVTEGAAFPATSADEGFAISAPNKVDESIPVAVQAEQVPGGEAATESVTSSATSDAVDASHELVNRVLGTDEEGSASSPIEDSVPVPNLEHERGQRPSEGRNAVAGKKNVNEARSNRANGGLSSQSWTSDQSMQQSQKTWSHISSSKDEPTLRIDENVPVNVDGKQVGKREGEEK